ncbi:MAG: hypothetical protein J7619_15830 [Dyadobacter sp.]|uniref:DUF6934 family protein n=1 Tax=Dyadobacter sp. TaxID=1914288 RepID=UPI001B08091A|nr:hypothetical protein [Dyadobacter sp.]MBO9614176.1 hypothetical protein [Dyadobacter sp.]
MGQYATYHYDGNLENTRFQFQSVGKRGVFEKVVYFTFLTEDMHNLSLVDFDPATKEYNDMSVTDNGDMPEILATVIAIIHEFFNSHPDQKIYFRGSTPTRTRLYQIAISKVYDQDNSDLFIKGYLDEDWVPFEPNVNFHGFLVEKKF